MITETTYRLATEILLAGGRLRERPARYCHETREMIARLFRDQLPTWAQTPVLGSETEIQLVRDMVKAAQYWMADQGYYFGVISGNLSREHWIGEQRAFQDRGWERDPDPIPPASVDTWEPHQGPAVEFRNPLRLIDFWSGEPVNITCGLASAAKLHDALVLLTNHYGPRERTRLGLDWTARGNPGEIIINPAQNRPHWRQDRAANAQPQMATVHQALRGAGYECVGIHTNQHWDMWVKSDMIAQERYRETKPYYGPENIWPKRDQIQKQIKF